MDMEWNLNASTTTNILFFLFHKTMKLQEETLAIVQKVKLFTFLVYYQNNNGSERTLKLD